MFGAKAGEGEASPRVTGSRKEERSEWVPAPLMTTWLEDGQFLFLGSHSSNYEFKGGTYTSLLPGVPIISEGEDNLFGFKLYIKKNNF